MTTEAQFLYPYIDQFPFDSVCGRIVEELQKRNWEVPGITVELCGFQTGDDKYCRVATIAGQDFLLRFSRFQRHLPGQLWEDSAAVSELIIPGKELHVFENWAARLLLYTGQDWERDRAQFMGNQHKVNAKLKGETKTYLRYEGAERYQNKPDPACFFGHPFLVAMKDPREYEPEGNDPTHFETAQVMEEFRDYLEKQVLTANIMRYLPCP